MNIQELESFIDQSRLVPQWHALKMLAVVKAAKAVERTSGSSIADLCALSVALAQLEEDYSKAPQ